MRMEMVMMRRFRQTILRMTMTRRQETLIPGELNSPVLGVVMDSRELFMSG